jgi:hypothetical protein
LTCSGSTLSIPLAYSTILNFASSPLRMLSVQKVCYRWFQVLDCL